VSIPISTCLHQNVSTPVTADTQSAITTVLFVVRLTGCAKRSLPNCVLVRSILCSEVASGWETADCRDPILIQLFICRHYSDFEATREQMLITLSARWRTVDSAVPFGRNLIYLEVKSLFFEIAAAFVQFHLFCARASSRNTQFAILFAMLLCSSKSQQKSLFINSLPHKTLQL
jgi:hypothetical protein